jgi:hypothetical protein
MCKLKKSSWFWKLEESSLYLEVKSVKGILGFLKKGYTKWMPSLY